MLGSSVGAVYDRGSVSILKKVICVLFLCHFGWVVRLTEISRSSKITSLVTSKGKEYMILVLLQMPYLGFWPSPSGFFSITSPVSPTHENGSFRRSQIRADWMGLAQLGDSYLREGTARSAAKNSTSVYVSLYRKPLREVQKFLLISDVTEGRKWSKIVPI